jgi:hypothetical protein
MKDQFDEEVNVGDWVLHVVPGENKKLMCSRVVELLGKTRIRTDLEILDRTYAPGLGSRKYWRQLEFNFLLKCLKNGQLRERLLIVFHLVITIKRILEERNFDCFKHHNLD